MRYTPFLLLALANLAVAAPTFIGEWDTTYGRMSLKAETADGARLSGTYRVAGEPVNTLNSSVATRTFTFTYAEAEVSGDGSFTLAEDGASFDGKWRPAGSAAWST